MIAELPSVTFSQISNTEILLSFDDPGNNSSANANLDIWNILDNDWESAGINPSVPIEKGKASISVTGLTTAGLYRANVSVSDDSDVHTPIGAPLFSVS